MPEAWGIFLAHSQQTLVPRKIKSSIRLNPFSKLLNIAFQFLGVCDKSY